MQSSAAAASLEIEIAHAHLALRGVLSRCWQRLARLEDVDWFEIALWSEGGPSGEVFFKNGENLFVPSVCMPSNPAYARTLRDLGLAPKTRSSCSRYT